uniref:Clathrin assembly protein At2g25430 n=1 Tax=Nicotiana sylvestris TaxID=4096 RepID=A0A1U7YPM2_NICSY|nr:PREDICTED: putative clathrin assembly protein At2g25430 [Nicotiana sylvestris]
MKHIIRDSFTCYTTFRKEIVEVLDYLIHLPYKSCVAAFEIYKNAAIQANEISGFYDWCKSLGLCGMYEYPFIDKIPQIQIRALENFLNGMWQLTDDLSSSSTSVSLVTSTPQSPSSEDGSNKQKSGRKSSFEGQSLTRKGESEMQPLIQFEDDND